MTYLLGFAVELVELLHCSQLLWQLRDSHEPLSLGRWQDASPFWEEAPEEVEQASIHLVLVELSLEVQLSCLVPGVAAEVFEGLGQAFLQVVRLLQRQMLLPSRIHLPG